MGRSLKKIEDTKVKTGITLDSNILSLMDEYLKSIDDTNRSKYIENLIKEDLKIK